MATAVTPTLRISYSDLNYIFYGYEMNIGICKICYLILGPFVRNATEFATLFTLFYTNILIYVCVIVRANW